MITIESVGSFIGLIAGIISGVALICGIIFAFVKWVLKQNKQSDDIEALKKRHDEDIKNLKAELCVISFAMLATLDGLKQLNCNGEVTKAHDMLQKHLNKSAHGQE